MPRKPSNGNIVYGFGMRLHPILGVRRMHNGLDIGWGNGAGTTLVAPQRAQLIDYRDRGDWGMQARLRAGNIEHRLAHTARLWSGISVGEWLDEDQAVAVMGETGMADGVHVHWEVLKDGKYIDPIQWLSEASAQAASTTTTTTTDVDDEEYDMEPIYITESAQAAKFELRGGRKRSVSKAEWKALRAAESKGRTLYVVIMTAAEISSIPGK